MKNCAYCVKTLTWQHEFMFCVYECYPITESHKQFWKQVWEEVVISGKSECRKSHNIKVDISAFERVVQFIYLGITLTCLKIPFRKKLRAD
jgi:hypothetical protein